MGLSQICACLQNKSQLYFTAMFFFVAAPFSFLFFFLMKIYYHLRKTFFYLAIHWCQNCYTHSLGRPFSSQSTCSKGRFNFYFVMCMCTSLFISLCFLTVNRRLDEWVKLEQLDLDSVETVVDEKVEDKVMSMWYFSITFFICFSHRIYFLIFNTNHKNCAWVFPGYKLENDTPPEAKDWRDTCRGKYK